MHVMLSLLQHVFYTNLGTLYFNLGVFIPNNCVVIQETSLSRTPRPQSECLKLPRTLGWGFE